jgi:hypothetical protein
LLAQRGSVHHSSKLNAKLVSPYDQAAVGMDATSTMSISGYIDGKRNIPARETKSHTILAELLLQKVVDCKGGCTGLVAHGKVQFSFSVQPLIAMDKRQRSSLGVLARKDQTMRACSDTLLADVCSICTS